MKIAILADAYLTDQSTGVNGTQVQLYQLAHAFKERGHEVHYVCATRTKNVGRQTDDDGLALHFLPDREGVFVWLTDIRDAVRQLTAIAPDAVYQRGRSPLTYAAARWARRHTKPFVWGSNGEDSGEFFKFRTRLFQSNRNMLKKLLLVPDMWLRDLGVHRGLAGASHFVSQTAHQQSRLRTNFGKEAVVLPSYFRLPTRASSVSRERMMLWLANLDKNKQPEIFVDMAAALRGAEGWRFVLAGGTADKGLEASLRQRAAQVPSFEFAGAVPFAATGALFARAALHVNTSLIEGLPNTFVQAWLNGTPVLSLHNDPNGWIETHGLGYHAKGRPEGLVAEAKRLIDNPDELETMGRRCTEFARANFANPAVIDTYLRLFSGRTHEAH